MRRTNFTPNDFIIKGDICLIGCYNHRNEFVDYAIIDVDDIEKCKPYKWCIANGRATTTNKNGIGSSKMLPLHRLISGIFLVDHKNLNKLDNRKDNLRPATKSQNGANTGLRKDNTSGYKGVSVYGRYYDHYTWAASIQIDGKKKHLGVFPTPELAALAYNEAASAYYGEFARLNHTRS